MTMIYGVGADLLDISRMSALNGNYADPFFVRTFTSGERDQAASRTDPDAYFATRFAGKEAVFKCLRIDGDLVRLGDIEIITDTFGVPRVKLNGMLQLVAQRKGIQSIHLSLSWDGQYALAFALAVMSSTTRGSSPGNENFQ
ncbi:MAG: holo-ACP synthase [Desulfopila sp.]